MIRNLINKNLGESGNGLEPFPSKSRCHGWETEIYGRDAKDGIGERRQGWDRREMPRMGLDMRETPSMGYKIDGKHGMGYEIDMRETPSMGWDMRETPSMASLRGYDFQKEYKITDWHSGLLGYPTRKRTPIFINFKIYKCIF